MILVRRELKGKVYTEPFSKGILSRTLIRAELNPSKAYEIANKIESDLKNCRFIGGRRSFNC